MRGRVLLPPPVTRSLRELLAEERERPTALDLDAWAKRAAAVLVLGGAVAVAYSQELGRALAAAACAGALLVLIVAAGLVAWRGKR